MSQPEIRSVSAVNVGDIWTAIITGVRHVHSLIIEAWGANGGITRILPQGRDEVRVELKFAAPGRTNLSLTLRDERLGASQAFETSIDVTPPGVRPAYAMQQSWRGPMGGRLDAHAGAPPFQHAAPSAPRAASGKGAYGGMSGPFEVNLGDVIAVSYSVPATAKSVSYSASNADLNFVGPMPVYDSLSEMSARALAEGPASIHGVARDESGMVVHEASHVVQVRRKQDRPHSLRAYGEMIGPIEAKIGDRIIVRFSLDPEAVSARFTASNANMDPGPTPVGSGTAEAVAVMVAAGVAEIVAETYDRQSNLLRKYRHLVNVVINDMRGGYGGMDGPSEAKVGDTVYVRFNLPIAGLTVKFWATNAVVGFVGPMPVEEVSAETSVQMSSPGRATVFAEAFDKLGNLARSASHIIEVIEARRDDAKVDRSLNDLASDMQRSLESSIRARLNRD